MKSLEEYKAEKKKETDERMTNTATLAVDAGFTSAQAAFLVAMFEALYKKSDNLFSF